MGLDGVGTILLECEYVRYVCGKDLVQVCTTIPDHGRDWVGWIGWVGGIRVFEVVWTGWVIGRGDLNYQVPTWVDMITKNNLLSLSPFSPFFVFNLLTWNGS
jgi:hypothetical protein